MRDNLFGEHHTIVWNVLEHLGMDSEVHRLLSVGDWVTFFAYDVPAYRELMLEVVTTFVANQAQVSWDLDNTIQFRICGR